MRLVTTKRAILTTTLGVLLLSPSALRAQATRAPSADDAALRGYVLTMGNLQKLKQSMLNLKAWVAAHPDAADSLGSGDDDSSSQTLAQMISHIEAVPPMKEAILKAGFTPRDYVMTMMTYMQASMQFAVAQSLKGKPMKIPDNMNPANASFVQTHKAELDKLDLAHAMGEGSNEP
jgi:hypothetical protein